MATVKEIISECGEGKTIEVYAYRGKTHRLHSDFITNVDEVYSEDIYLNKEATDYEVMDEERYNETILANTSMDFSDFFDVNDEVLVIILPEDWEIDETVETEPITHDKMQMAELLISLPGWDGLSDPKALCEQFTDEQLLDILDAYNIEFSSIEYEGSKLEISEEQSERIESAHDRYDRKNTKRVSLKFNKRTDSEILEWLNKQESKQGAIKDAVMYKIRSERGEI